MHRRNTSARKPRLPKRRLPCNKAENGEEGENVDIDELARQLSRAARKRRSLSQSPFTDRPSDFDADDFEIVQSLGYLGVKVSERNDLILETEAPNKPTVVAFVARYFSGKPYQYPVLTLLKEFLPPSIRIAENEFRILSHLSQIPEDKWEVYCFFCEDRREWVRRLRIRGTGTWPLWFSCWATLEGCLETKNWIWKCRVDTVFGLYTDGKDLSH